MDTQNDLIEYKCLCCYKNYQQKFDEKSMQRFFDTYKFSNHDKNKFDLFENFRNMCLQIYELDPVRFLTAPSLAWQAALKKTKLKLDLLTDIDMLLMVEKGIRGGICHSIYQYAKANNKYMKD